MKHENTTKKYEKYNILYKIIILNIHTFQIVKKTKKGGNICHTHTFDNIISKFIDHTETKHHKQNSLPFIAAKLSQNQHSSPNSTSSGGSDRLLINNNKYPTHN